MEEPASSHSAPDVGSGIALPLARVVFNPTTVLFGTAFALVWKGIDVWLDRLEPALAPLPEAMRLPRLLADRPFSVGVPAILAIAAAFVLAGVAIARAAALKVCRGESVSPGESLRFAARHWLAAALYPLAIATGALGCLAIAGILGLIGQIPFLGHVLLVVLYPIAIGLGLAATIIAVLGLAAAPSVAGALAVERNG